LTTRARKTRVVSSDSVGTGVIADIGGGRLPGQRPHGGHHPAVVLEVVVRVGDVVLTGVGVFGGDGDAPVLAVHVVGGLPAVQAPPIRKSAPRRVDLRQVGIVTPVTAVDQLQQPGAVCAWL
jgi:hypothetical protein